MDRAAEKINEYQVRGKGHQTEICLSIWGKLTGDGRSEADVRRRMQVGVNVWRREERLMAGKQLSKKWKGKVLVSCVMPAYLYGLLKVALTENQQQWLQVYETD